jgi:hypothetical protein
VRAAECRKEVVERVFVGQIDESDLSAPFVFITVEQIIVTKL